MKEKIHDTIKRGVKKVANLVDTASHKTQIAGNDLKDLTSKAAAKSDSSTKLEDKTDNFIDKAKKSISKGSEKVQDFIKKSAS